MSVLMFCSNAKRQKSVERIHISCGQQVPKKKILRTIRLSFLPWLYFPMQFLISLRMFLRFYKDGERGTARQIRLKVINKISFYYMKAGLDFRVQFYAEGVAFLTTQRGAWEFCNHHPLTSILLELVKLRYQDERMKVGIIGRQAICLSSFPPMIDVHWAFAATCKTFSLQEILYVIKIHL